MRYKWFWFRAVTERNGTKDAHVFVTENMEEAREYAKNMANRLGSTLLGVEVISKESAKTEG